MAILAALMFYAVLATTTMFACGDEIANWRDRVLFAFCFAPTLIVILILLWPFLLLYMMPDIIERLIQVYTDSCE